MREAKKPRQISKHASELRFAVLSVADLHARVGQIRAVAEDLESLAKRLEAKGVTEIEIDGAMKPDQAVKLLKTHIANVASAVYRQ